MCSAAFAANRDFANGLARLTDLRPAGRAADDRLRRGEVHTALRPGGRAEGTGGRAAAGPNHRRDLQHKVSPGTIRGRARSSLLLSAPLSSSLSSSHFSSLSSLVLSLLLSRPLASPTLPLLLYPVVHQPSTLSPWLRPHQASCCSQENRLVARPHDADPAHFQTRLNAYAELQTPITPIFEVRLRVGRQQTKTTNSLLCIIQNRRAFLR